MRKPNGQTRRTAPTPTTEAMTQHDVLNVAALATTYTERVEQMEAYFEDHDIFEDWNTAMRLLVAETGVRLNYERYDSPFFTAYHDYELTLAPEGVVVNGFHPHENDHTITIPYAFLAPDTRESVLAPLREQWHAEAEKQRIADAETDRRNAEARLRDAERAVEVARAEVAALSN